MHEARCCSRPYARPSKISMPSRLSTPRKTVWPARCASHPSGSPRSCAASSRRCSLRCALSARRCVRLIPTLDSTARSATSWRFNSSPFASVCSGTPTSGISCCICPTRFSSSTIAASRPRPIFTSSRSTARAAKVCPGTAPRRHTRRPAASTRTATTRPASTRQRCVPPSRRSGAAICSRWCPGRHSSSAAPRRPRKFSQGSRNATPPPTVRSSTWASANIWWPHPRRCMCASTGIASRPAPSPAPSRVARTRLAMPLRFGRFSTPRKTNRS